MTDAERIAHLERANASLHLAIYGDAGYRREVADKADRIAELTVLLRDVGEAGDDFEKKWKVEIARVERVRAAGRERIAELEAQRDLYKEPLDVLFAACTEIYSTHEEWGRLYLAMKHVEKAIAAAKERQDG